MVVSQSLLDSLKELNNLSNIDVKDPENEEFENAQISNFDSVEDGNGGDAGVKKFGNLRKKVNFDPVLDQKYAGKKASRKNLTWSDDDEEEEGEEDDEGINDDMDEEVMSEENDDEEQNGMNVNTDDDIDYIDDEDDDDDDDEVDEVDEDGDMLDNTMKIDFNKLPDDLKGDCAPKVLANRDDDDDGDDDVDNFTASMKDDNLMKGQSTKLQLDILDKLLESRIRIQKSLNLCNQLPQLDMMSEFREQSGPQIKESYESARNITKDLLNKLFRLQGLLCETNAETSSVLTKGSVDKIDPGDEEIPSDTEDEEDENDEKKPANENEDSLNLPSKRKHTLGISDYGEEIVKRHKALQPFQDATIKKWHDKTRLASSSISSKNFASFDKSVLQQIKQSLLDKEKLIKRTQLSRVPLSILGTDDTEVKNENTANLHLTDYNENIFDDGDFYHEMLKELIERKSDIDGDDPIATGRRWLELQKLRSKIKRKVDTRASKGRKVRYDVHTKLVSFMAPQNVGAMSNQARNNLFASLFGQKPTLSSF